MLLLDKHDARLFNQAAGALFLSLVHALPPDQRKKKRRMQQPLLIYPCGRTVTASLINLGVQLRCIALHSRPIVLRDN